MFINFARRQTDENESDVQSVSPRRTLPRVLVRRRADRLRDLWSEGVRFSALEDNDEEPDDDDWSVDFSERVGCTGYLPSTSQRKIAR